MGILDWLRGRDTAPVGVPPRAPAASVRATAPQRRGWLAAAPSRLLADLPGGAAAAPNREIRQSLEVLRARARWLAQNDGYTKGFLKMLRRNVVGPNGFNLQMRVPDDRDPRRQDEAANRIIEAAYKRWCAVGVCDAAGRMSLTQMHHLLITSLARDGEYLVRKLRGTRFGEFAFALQVLDPSLLDVNLTIGAGTAFVGSGYRLPAGHTLRMGVECDEFGRPVAYHLRTNLPGDDVWRTASASYVRVPAADIIHRFVSDWPGQVRGVTWFETAIRPLAMLDGYSEAELVAARVSSEKMGFYKMAQGADADDVPADLKEDAKLVQQSEAGSFEMLPPGIDFEAFDPQHPNSAFKDFVGGILRQAGAGVGMSYNAFANDAEGLNYSALRATALGDRDEWRTLQGNEVESFCAPVFAEWLRQAMLAGAINLPAGKYAKFNAPYFVPRGWDWVDPAKEVAAATDAVALGIRSRTQIVASAGGDFADTLVDLKAEAEAMKDLPPPPAAKPKPMQENTDAAAQ